MSAYRGIAEYAGIWPFHPLRVVLVAAEMWCLWFLLGEGGWAPLLAGFILALTGTVQGYDLGMRQQNSC